MSYYLSNSLNMWNFPYMLLFLDAPISLHKIQFESISWPFLNVWDKVHNDKPDMWDWALDYYAKRTQVNPSYCTFKIILEISRQEARFLLSKIFLFSMVEVLRADMVSFICSPRQQYIENFSSVPQAGTSTSPYLSRFLL